MSSFNLSYYKRCAVELLEKDVLVYDGQFRIAKSLVHMYEELVLEYTDLYSLQQTLFSDDSSSSVVDDPKRMAWIEFYIKSFYDEVCIILESLDISHSEVVNALRPGDVPLTPERLFSFYRRGESKEG